MGWCGGKPFLWVDLQKGKAFLLAKKHICEVGDSKVWGDVGDSLYPLVKTKGLRISWSPKGTKRLAIGFFDIYEILSPINRV